MRRGGGGGGGCDHKKWVHKNLKFHSFPRDDKIKRKWISAISLKRKDYKWDASHRVCMVDIFTDFNDHRSSTVSVYVPKVIEARDEIQMAPESQESPQTPVVSMSEDVVRKECECQQKIDRLQERVRKLEEQSVVERFGVRRFMASDSDMRFYTGLPDY